MNVSTWAASPAWTAAGWTMLHFLWVGGALAAIAAIGRRALRNAHPDVRYAYALATLAALALAPAAIAWTIADAPRAALATPREARPTAGGPFGIIPANSTPKRIETDVEPTLPKSSYPDTLIYMSLVARTLPGVWLVGAPWTFAYLVAGLLGAERLRRRSRVVGDDDLSALTDRLAESLGIARRVTVGVCDRIAGPMLLGIARPLILLPASALSGWRPEQIEMALLHELAHVRRWDNFVSLLQRVIESALFFHPAVWIVSGWVRREREHCCDRIVVDHTGRALDYAGALFILADADAPGAPLAHGAFMAHNHLVDRIRRILNPEEPAMKLSRSAVAFAASTLAVPALLLAFYIQQPSPQPPVEKADLRQTEEESRHDSTVNTALSELKIASRVIDVFKRDPSVAAVIQDIQAVDEELEHTRSVTRFQHDPARMVAEKRKAQLTEKYEDLWRERNGEIRRQVLDEMKAGVPDGLEDWVSYAFRRDPDVVALVEEIIATDDELEHTKNVQRKAHDPARKAAEKRKAQLLARYIALWEERHDKIRRQLLPEVDPMPPQEIEARVNEAFRRDPSVAALIQDIQATGDELEHTKNVARRGQDPARKAAEKRKSQLTAKYNALWSERYSEIRRQVLAEYPKYVARGPGPIPAPRLVAFTSQQQPQAPEAKAAAKPPVPEYRQPRLEVMKKAVVKPGAAAWEPGPIPETISVNVSGVARDEQGEPVAGASLTLYTIASEGLSLRTKSVATAVSDASGRYEFRDARLSVQTSLNGHPFPKEQTPYAPFFILGQAPGMGVAWSKQPSIYAVKSPHPNDIQGRLPLGEPATLDLTFAREAVLQGKVVDERGQQVAGAKVQAFNAISLDAEGRETGNFQGYDWSILPDGVGRATTGADGGFKLDRLSERFCHYLSVNRPESPNTVLSLRAATIGGPDATHEEPPIGPDFAPRSHQARTNPITITFPTIRPIDVTVVGDDDGKPVAGAEIRLGAPWWSTGSSSGGVADAAGKIRLGLPPGDYAVAASRPPKDSRYLRTNQGPLIVEAGDAPLSLEIRQKPGAEVILEAVEAGTGKPIPDVYFWRTVDDQPDQEIEPGDELVELLSQTSTNEQGKVRALLPPRPGRRYRFFFGGMREPNSGGFAPGAPQKNGYEASPAQSEPVELVPGKPIRLRFELRKGAVGLAPATIPVRVSGVARDEQGRLLSAAKITLWGLTDERVKRVAKTDADAEGRYEFREAVIPVRAASNTGPSPKDHSPSAAFIVSGEVPGMGLAWSEPRSMYAVEPPYPGDGVGRLRLGEPVTLDLTFSKSAAPDLKAALFDAEGRPTGDIPLYDAR